MGLKQEIKNKSAQEIESVLRKARRIKEREINSALDKKKLLLEQEEAKIDKELEQRLKRVRANLELEYKIKYLVSRDKLVSELVQKVAEELKNFPREESYFVFLKQMLQKALLELKDGNLTISLNKRDLEKYSQSLREILKDREVDFEPLDITGGFIIKSERARLVFNASFENLISSSLNEIKEKLIFNLKNGKY